MYYFSIQSHSIQSIKSSISGILVVALFLMHISPALVYAQELMDVETSSSEGVETTELPALIETGEAISAAEINSVVNLNDISAEFSSTTEDLTTNITQTDSDTEPSDTQESTAGSESVREESVHYGSSDQSIIASTTNDAVVTTEADVSAVSGSSTATGDESVIVSGNAIAYANIVNVVNTNIFNSQGAIEFFNETLGANPFDLRNNFTVFNTPVVSPISTISCAASVCGNSTPNQLLNFANSASLTNTLDVSAQSGGNVSGDSSIIRTGNAYAAANIFNVANTNIVDSNYLLVAFNNFGDYTGDIVLPGADVFDSLFNTAGTPLESGAIDVNNAALIENNISVAANTGSNSAASGVISTGNAYANSGTYNNVNTNLFGGSDFLLVLRVHGDWKGEIFGLPEGIAWAETEHGIALYNTSNSGAGTPASNTELNGTSTASINNNVTVYALTGDNRVGEGGVVDTGNAYAAANVTNVANTNILGQNWALLIFDIFGNWSGNLAFGRPDLWVGGSATSPDSTIMPGSEVAYTYTISNNGDAVATDVIFEHQFNPAELLYVSDASRVEQNSLGSFGHWLLGDIAPHETKVVHFTTRVHNELSTARHEIISSAIVRAQEPDANDRDNTELHSFFSGKNSSGNGKSRGSSATGNIKLVKTADVHVATPGSSVNYTINITNRGGPVHKSLLRDILRNSDGATTSEQYWDLGTILAGETISVTYTVEFAHDAMEGQYVNNADIIGYSGNSNISRAKSYTSPSAAHTLIISNATPQVLGATDTSCLPYLTTYMKIGAQNDAEEVTKLQQFMQTHMKSTLTVNGVFDLQTEIAVRKFQQRYADEILTPWGLLRDSGIVYYTTQKKINEIQCNNQKYFPLSADQNTEIYNFKSATEMFSNTTLTASPYSTSSRSDNVRVMMVTTNEPVILNNREESTESDLAHISTKGNALSVIKKYFLSPLQRAIHWFQNFAVKTIPL